MKPGTVAKALLMQRGKAFKGALSAARKAQETSTEMMSISTAGQANINRFPSDLQAMAQTMHQKTKKKERSEKQVQRLDGALGAACDAIVLKAGGGSGSSEPDSKRQRVSDQEEEEEEAEEEE